MNAILGMAIFAVGGIAGALFLVPSRGIRNCAYESWWIFFVLFGQLLAPAAVCWAAVPHFWDVVMSASPVVLARCIGFGMLWGVGSIMWGLMIRYLGVGFGMPIGCGTGVAVGMLLPPVATGHAADLVADASSLLVLGGVLCSIVGIVVLGMAGCSKDKEMSAGLKRKAVADFDLKKGLAMAVVSGFFSAGLNFGLQGASAIEEAAVAAGASECFRGAPVVMVVFWGGALVSAAWCLNENRKNRTFGDYSRLSLRNIALCAIIGIGFIVQAMAIKVGEPLMGRCKYISFGMVMTMTTLFSTAAGVFLGEWRGTSARTRATLALGTFVLIAGFIVISIGSR